VVDDDFGRLTRREARVAVLVANGLSDREISQSLSITTRTAEWHVQQILTKLDLKSRSQIAARVARAEVLGFLLADPDKRLDRVPAQAAAFLGYRPELSQAHQVLETTRLLSWPVRETDLQGEQRLAALADAGYNPVIVRITYAAVLGKVAKRYPGTQFAIVDDSTLSAVNKNVTSLVFADHQGSYLVGAIAAQASKLGTIGFVGGVHIPLIQRFEAGYVAGARALKPDIKVLIRYLTDPPDFSGFAARVKAKSAAEAMYRGGADVVYHAAGGSGPGVFQAAKLAGALAIGVDSDEYLTAPPDTKATILTSMLKYLDAAVTGYLKSFVSRSPFTGVKIFDLANDGVGYSKSNTKVMQYVEKAERLREQIVAGKIRVPDKP
jgi:basic membrane protein A